MEKNKTFSARALPFCACQLEIACASKAKLCLYTTVARAKHSFASSFAPESLARQTGFLNKGHMSLLLSFAFQGQPLAGFGLCRQRVVPISIAYFCTKPQEKIQHVQNFSLVRGVHLRSFCDLNKNSVRYKECLKGTPFAMFPAYAGNRQPVQAKLASERTLFNKAAKSANATSKAKLCFGESSAKGQRLLCGSCASKASLCLHISKGLLVPLQAKVDGNTVCQTCFKQGNRNSVAKVETTAASAKVAQEKLYIFSTKLEQPEIPLSKPRFINVLMSSGQKGRAYRVLLTSISICKSKMLGSTPKVSASAEARADLAHQKRVFACDPTFATGNTKRTAAQLRINPELRLAEHVNTESNVALCRDNETTTSRKQHSNLYRLHTSAQQALEKARIALPSQSLVAQKEQSKRCWQSNQICGKTLANVEPIVETRGVRVRGSTYQVPSTLHFQRRERMAIYWIITNACMKRKSNKEALSRSLGQEFFDCINRQGVSVQKKDQMHRLAANSRVYMRYRWW